MGQMQDKILSEVKKYAEASGLEFVQSAEYENTGAIFFMKGMSSEFTMVYDFQPQNATLEFYRKGATPQRTYGSVHKDCLLKTHLTFSKDFTSKMEEVQKLIAVCADTDGNQLWERG